MRVKHYAYRLLAAVCAFATIACVDDSFRLDNISTEVTVGSGTTTLPLGYLNDKTLGELIEGQNIEGLHIADNGDISFSYVGESETIDIEGISTEFEIPQINTPFVVEYPDFSVNVSDVSVDAFDDIDIYGLDTYSGMSFSVPGGITVSADYSKVFEGEDYHVEFDVPEQIAAVNKVLFSDPNGGDYGAPMRVRVDFNGLSAVNGGGKLSYNFSIEGASFRLLDADGKLVCDGKSYGNELPFAAGDDYVEFVVYVESITNNVAIDSNHHLDIPLKLTFDMAFDFTTKAGSVNMNALPKVTFDGDFAYGDAEVTMNSDVNIADCAGGGNPITIANLPAELKMVNRVGMKQDNGAVLDLYVRGMEWLGADAEEVEVVASLPECLKLYYINGQNYTYDASEGTVTTTVAELAKGIAVGLTALDFGAEGLVPEDGVIELEFTPSVSVRFKDDARVNVSSLLHEGNINLEVGVEETVVNVESFSGRVDYTYEVEQAFALSGLDELDLDLEINGIGLKPIIEVNITHPLTMSAKVSGSVEPSVGGEVMQNNIVSFSDVALAPAKYVDGKIESADITLVIADESLRANYIDEKYTFIACDVTKLLLGASLPDTVNIKLSLGVDAEQTQTLYIADDFSISYGYRLDLPFAVDNSLDVRYSDEIGELNSIFEQLSEFDIQVGDVAVIATVTNSTPLQLGANVLFKDANGNDADVQVTIADDAIIKGSADGVTPEVSVLRFDLDLGDGGRVANLTTVDAIAFELAATSAAEDISVPLNINQYVGVKLQLELAGGITVDVGDFVVVD